MKIEHSMKEYSNLILSYLHLLQNIPINNYKDTDMAL